MTDVGPATAGTTHRALAAGRMTWHADFERPLVLAGWSPRSRWGFDSRLECFWVEVVAAGDEVERPVTRIGPEHLITTVAGLSRALGHAVGTPPDDAFLALTA